MQQLFGQKVLNDFIQKQDEKLIENRWQRYKNFLAKKEKISSWIETDYQDGFLEDIFENDKTLTCKLKTEIAKTDKEIDKTDKEIDKMVYELYGLSDEEIGIVEGV